MSGDGNPQDEAARVRKKALDLLARREHSCRELRDKLVRKGFPAPLAGHTVEALAAEDLISDTRYAESWLRHRRQKGYGPVRIRQELREKGVDPEIIQRFVRFDDPRWLAELGRVREKKFGPAPPAGSEERARQARFLQYRGFVLEQILKVLDADTVIDASIE